RLLMGSRMFNLCEAIPSNLACCQILSAQGIEMVRRKNWNILLPGHNRTLDQLSPTSTCLLYSGPGENVVALAMEVSRSIHNY
ncbi:hypothetical protein L195_g060979, partial [Trifolium pratense]